jgi:DNA-binding CsgD family transcriptional regulator
MRTGSVRYYSRKQGQELTDRELDVLELVSSGYTNKQIAARLGITSKCVEWHRKSIRRKLRLPSPFWRGSRRLIRGRCDRRSA